MKKLFIITAIIISIFSCDSTGQKGNFDKKQKDSFLLKESFNQVDEPTNEYLEKKLKPIRENFKRINSIPMDDWSSVVTKNLEGTNEGGDVTYYHWNNELDKIITKEFGETFQVLTEYYLMNGELSFIYQKALKYNRSIWKQNPEHDDNEVFDISKSVVEETRNYFESGKLINQISSDDCGSLFSEEYLQEQQNEFIYNFNRVLKLEEKK